MNHTEETMTRKSPLHLLDIMIAIGVLISSGVGVFYHTLRFDKVAENVYGDAVPLFGRGIYAFESAFQGPIFVGTDIVMLCLAVVFVILRWRIRHRMLNDLIHIGFLTIFLYYSASLAFSTMMNPLFIVYMATFALVLFHLIHQLLGFNTEPLEVLLKQHKLPKGLRPFLIIMALSVSVWLLEIGVLMVDGRPSTLIGMKTTEPTYIFDLALIAPTCFLAAIGLKKHRPFSLVLATMMLSLLAAIGSIVIAQNLTQSYFGITIEPIELILFVLIFTVLSGVAIYYLVRLYHSILKLNVTID